MEQARQREAEQGTWELEKKSGQHRNKRVQPQQVNQTPTDSAVTWQKDSARAWENLGIARNFGVRATPVCHMLPTFATYCLFVLSCLRYLPQTL